MPNPISLTPNLLNELRTPVTEKLKFAILFAKTAGNPVQNINLSEFALAQQTTDENVNKAVQALESAKLCTASYGILELKWLQEPVLGSVTAASIQEAWNSGLLDDPSYYCYLALGFSKTPGTMIQQVDVANFATAPWNIPKDTMLSEIATHAARKATTLKPLNNAHFESTYGQVQLTWSNPLVP